jgi:hypothetical protein
MVKQSRIVQWFAEHDFEAIKRVMPDDASLPPSYAEWLLSAEQNARKLESAGIIVRKVPITAAEFTAYCAMIGQSCNFATLGAFAMYADKQAR